MRALALISALLVAAPSIAGGLELPVAMTTMLGTEPRARCAACSLLPIGATGSDLTLTGSSATVVLAIKPNSSCIGYGGSLVGESCVNASGWTAGANPSDFVFYYGNQLRLTGSAASGAWSTAYAFLSSTGSGNTGIGVTVNGAKIDFGAGASDHASSDGTTITFAGPISVGTPVVTSSLDLGANASIQAANGFVYNTAPTISSGFGTSPSVAASNGTATFTINVGTGGTATSGVIGLPNLGGGGWFCHCEDIASNAAHEGKQVVLTAFTASTCTIENQTSSTGAAFAWTASRVLSCIATARP